MINLSRIRIAAIYNKEWKKILRDPFTIFIIIFLSVIQVIMFGYGITVYPKHLRTAIVDYDESLFTHKFIYALENSEYFDIKYRVKDAVLAKDLLKNNDVSYVITIPVNFTQDLVRNRKPNILVELDASAPSALGNAYSVIQSLVQSVFTRELQGTLHYVDQGVPPVGLYLHAKYNESLLSVYSLAPGVICATLLVLLTLLTSIAVSEEKISGTLETLFKSPVKPLEIIFGKALCYFLIAYIILAMVLPLVVILFHLPFYGGILNYLLAAIPFVLCNILFGMAMSAGAKNQIEAQQYIGIYTVFSFLFSGFILPFDGMPTWAKALGDLLPMTHFIRISSGIILKNYNWNDIWPNEIPILMFLLAMIFLMGILFRRESN